MTDQPVKRKPGRPKKVVEVEISENAAIEVGEGYPPSSVGSFNGAPEAAFDHDGDGQPGGSKRKDASVGKHELEALTREAFEAYDMQDDRIRFDSMGRKWSFRMSSESGHWELLLVLQRGLAEEAERVPQLTLGSSAGMSAVFERVSKLDGVVK